ncbi:MAG: CDP-diacylglycerol--glycerol-3-phosphate 3-phosphatidyltransferase [Candidatus Pelagibacter sp.]|nr:CDP-diacylglycerol--glycerol-3-phosphate 3-phosphatidyltransferase [Candidatus Pelagibacter sp.]|tara:strand:- start:85 stop:627 length:543 start_codon:yes stop_codon:yes gene_type:complete
MNMANCLTLSRIFLIFPVLYFISDQSFISNWIALILFIFAGITDHLDGYIARKTKTTSSLGALLDLIADKLLICVTIIYLLSFTDQHDLIIPAMVIVSRELIVSSFRQFLAESLGNNPIKVSFIAKSKTTVQITALSFLIVSPNFDEVFYELTVTLFWVAAYISVHSLYEYIKVYRNLIK